MPDAQVRHFMSESVVTVSPETPLDRVAARMSGARVSCVVVCDADGVPQGVVSERDLTRAYARDMGRGAAPPVSEAMSDGVWALTGDARCSDAMVLMRERGIRRIVIIGEDGTLGGVITQTDLLRAHAEEIEIQKQVLEERVAERTRELKALNTRLETLTRVDPMLGIGNRRAMDDELVRMEQRALRYQRPYSICLLDVDHFKTYNDHYGHAEGDQALRRVASAIAESIRAADAVYRYGGEEFLVVLPEVGSEGAAVAGENMRRAVETLRIPHELSSHGHVTVSVGVDAARMDDPCWSKLITRADEALYVAKHGGRNRVERYRVRTPEPA